MENSQRYVPVDWFESYMAQFFSVFHLKNIKRLPAARLKTIRKILLDKDKTSPEDYESFSPARKNLLVVILWLLGLQEEALEEAKSAMHDHPNSISARSNMAYILWMRGERYKSYEILKVLKYCKTKHPQEFKELLITAEAQTAYCYTTLGPPYVLLAIKHFYSAIGKRPNVDVWKYALALNLRRLEHEESLTRQSDITVPQAQTKAFGLLVKVKDNKENSKELRELAAAELGKI